MAFGSLSLTPGSKATPTAVTASLQNEVKRLEQELAEVCQIHID